MGSLLPQRPSKSRDSRSSSPLSSIDSEDPSSPASSHDNDSDYHDDPPTKVDSDDEYIDVIELPKKRKRTRGGDSDSEMDLNDLDNPQKADKPWVCDLSTCRKAFARKSDLVRHVRIHNQDRPFVCLYSHCGKSFIQRSALTVHIRTHTGERPHACDQCDKAFADSSSLARHRRIHSGDRPYICTIGRCGKAFCRKVTLTKHQTKTHGAYDPQDLDTPPPGATPLPGGLRMPSAPLSPQRRSPTRASYSRRRRIDEDEDWVPDTLEAAHWQQTRVQHAYQYDQSRLHAPVMAPRPHLALNAISDVRSGSEAPPSDDERGPPPIMPRGESLPISKSRTPTLVPTSPRGATALPSLRPSYGTRYSLPTSLPTAYPVAARDNSPASHHSAPAQLPSPAPFRAPSGEIAHPDFVSRIDGIDGSALQLELPTRGNIEYPNRLPSWSTPRLAVHQAYALPPTAGNLHLNSHLGGHFGSFQSYSPPRSTLSLPPPSRFESFSSLLSGDVDSYSTFKI